MLWRRRATFPAWRIRFLRQSWNYVGDHPVRPTRTPAATRLWSAA